MGDKITGHRRQILANAFHIFPNASKNSTNSLSIDDYANIDVVLSAENHRHVYYYRAALLCGRPGDRKTAAQGDPDKSPEGALLHLLNLTAAMIWDQGGVPVVEHERKVPHGVVSDSIL